MSDDLIKRSDAIKVVWGEDINPSEDGVVFEAQSHIDRDIRLIPSEDRPQGEWIPCSERLPSESDYYLVTLRNAFDDIGICVIWFAYEDDYSEGSEWREITDDDTVLAWMPLPQPWKGADDE